ncbi:MAG TPA: cohesin domain-containing protein [Candidatus Limnocylindrales bacterium]|nr:cohesin domain-containing protein [Candidatus Limnocylindrales bacterium]
MSKLTEAKSLKIFIAIIVMLFLVLLAPSAVSAARDVSFLVGDARGRAGEQAVVTVSVNNAAGTDGGQFVLKFDPKLVTPVMVEAGALLANTANTLHMANLDYAAGQLMFMWVTAAGDTAASGVVCKITFTLEANGVARLEFGEIVLSPAGTTLGEVSPGKITIGEPGVNEGVSEEEENIAENIVEGTGNSDAGGGTGQGTPDVEEDVSLETGGRQNPLWFWLLVFVAAAMAVAVFLLYKRHKVMKRRTFE